MAQKLSGGLPSPPTEESKPVLSSRRSSKTSKANKMNSTTRTAKRSSTSSSHEHGGVVMDGRTKRVFAVPTTISRRLTGSLRACERCRMKKTKCDGESPCKRCKDDGLVCTAGSRKKPEFKQLPKGYAEVLENTQYALIATVQKLYTMVRNRESWDLGEPELNDRGLPVIHNIAEKLGCIRPSPDMPQSFPEDPEEFAALQAQLSMGGLLSSDSRSSEDSTSHPDRMERASSSDSERSVLSKDDAQLLWSQQEQQSASLAQFEPGLTLFDEPLFQNDDVKHEYAASNCEGSVATTSPVCSDFQTQPQVRSPSFRTGSPFSPWPVGGEEFLGQSHILDLTALYMQQQQQYKRSAASLAPRNVNVISNGTSMRASSFAPSNDGTIRPHMLDYNYGLDLTDQMDSVIFEDYEAITMG